HVLVDEDQLADPAGGILDREHERLNQPLLGRAGDGRYPASVERDRGKVDHLALEPAPDQVADGLELWFGEDVERAERLHAIAPEVDELLVDLERPPRRIEDLDAQRELVEQPAEPGLR